MRNLNAQTEVTVLRSKQSLLAVFSILCIAAHLGMRAIGPAQVSPGAFERSDLPLIVCLAFGGGPLVWDLVAKLVRRDFGSDLLAGMSIVTSVILGEYLAGSLVVLMLSGGEALESLAVRQASSVLEALAKRMPAVAHRKNGARIDDLPLADVQVGQTLLVLPHEYCPVDGTVLDGHGTMDESYLTGEPYLIDKAPGANVLSGSINGAASLTIRADKVAADSRYARIMRVMRESEQRRPRLRRLGDQLGAFYTPVAVAIALSAWAASGDVVRFLAVLVVATPCPLLIAIPVAIIGSISLAARRRIIVRDPATLENIDICRTAIFDKTGTLTYGKPLLTGIVPAENHNADEVLKLVASLEKYSKHPLSTPIMEAARSRNLSLVDVAAVSERPGEGLIGNVAGSKVQVTSRKSLMRQEPELANRLPAEAAGMECIVLVDHCYAAALQFRDEPRAEGASFVDHLRPKHHFDRVIIVSGDRESEVRHLADRVGIHDVYAGQSPEQKLRIVRQETERASTVFLGDGINDAPALAAATVGIAFGQNSDVTSEAAGAVILDSSLQLVDEFLHIGRRMRQIALQSAVGGMALSALAMLFAAAGYLPPVWGAVTQEIIDVLAVMNALRVAMPIKSLSDY